MNELLASEEYLLAFERYVRYGDTEQVNRMIPFSRLGYPLPNAWATALRYVMKKNRIHEVEFQPVVERQDSTFKAFSFMSSNIETAFLVDPSLILEQLSIPNKTEKRRSLSSFFDNEGSEYNGILGIPDHPMYKLVIMKLLSDEIKNHDRLEVKITTSTQNICYSFLKTETFSYPHILVDHESVRPDVEIKLSVNKADRIPLECFEFENSDENYNTLCKILRISRD